MMCHNPHVLVRYLLLDPITHLGVSDSYEDVVKELLDLLIEESGRVHSQLSENEHLRNKRGRG